MRLINTQTYVMKNFVKEEDIPPYAILSHVWAQGDGVEVSYADMQDLRVAQRRQEWPKVAYFCALAHQNGLEWGWDDTFCINKSDSAELSQALNSMYAWYGGARVCYAYLSDVKDPAEEDPAVEESSFQRSRWFKRGWTLQELIAPKVVLFYSKSWKPLGSKLSLAGVIEAITKIDAAVLMQTQHMDDVSIARRMSWASTRVTTLIEDRAYSLMGIFGVNMPTIYGEGRGAFIRLQLEIIRTSNDQSIFAWGKPNDFEVLRKNENAYTDNPRWATDFRSLLASSPDRFKDSADVVPFSVDDFKTYTHPGISCDVPEYTPTNYGIQVHLPLCMITPDVGLALLACKHATTGELVSLLVRRREPSTNRFYVGMYTPNAGPISQFDWQPPLRMYLMQPQSHIACSRILRNVKLARMYLHSYNANPQRSIAQGLANGELILRRPPSTSDVPEPTRRVSFVIHGWLLQKLAEMNLKVAGYGEPKLEFAGWAPTRALWRQDSGVGLRLTLEPPPTPDKDEDEDKDKDEVAPRLPTAPAAVLFHRPPPDGKKEMGDAFGLIFGLTEVGTAWATVAIVARESAFDERSVSHADHELVRGLLPQFPPLTELEAENKGYAVAGWQNNTCEVRAGKPGERQRVVRLSLTRWLPTEEPGVLDRDSVMTYTVGLEFDFGPDLRLRAMSKEEKIASLAAVSVRAT